jgi:methylmalonyl-CoA/ethylmalonyl-CoA epimerase
MMDEGPTIVGVQEVSVAVDRLGPAVELFRRLGLAATDEVVVTTPPVQSRTVSFDAGNCGIAVMASTEGDTPISRFVERRGEGLFCVTLAVREIEAVADAWRSQGVEFVRERALEVTDGVTVGRPVPRLLVNWTRPSTTHGVVLEIQEYLDRDGRPCVVGPAHAGATAGSAA